MTQRTPLQNRALHLYFQMLADALNEAGLDMRKTLEPEVDIPWNKDTIKNYLWRPVQSAQLGKDSTTELDTKEIDQVLETLNRHLGEKFGIHTPWPNIEEIMMQLRIKENE